MTANQRQLTTKTKATPAPIPAVRIKSGTAMGKVSVPAKGRISTRAFLRATGLGTARFWPPKWSLFGAFSEPEKAFSKRFHENSLRNHAPHSSQKHIFIKNIKTYEKNIEKKVLNSACTQGRQNDTRS